MKSAHTKPCGLLRNHEIIDELSSESMVRYFYKHDTTDLCGARTIATIQGSDMEQFVL